MAPRPRCPVCRSRKWHRDQLSGSQVTIVCEEGHLLQGYVNESNEANGPSQHVATRQRVHKARRKSTRPPPNAHYHGQRSTFLVWQALQLVLRRQLSVLIDELGWPVQLEPVARDLWAVLLASSGVPDAPGDWAKGDEPASTFTGPVKGMGHPRGPRKGTQRKGKSNDEDKATSEDENGDDDERTQKGSDEEEKRRQSSESDSASLIDDDDYDDDDDDFGFGAEEDRSAKNSRPRAPLPQAGPKSTRTGHYIYADPRKRPKPELLLLIIYLSAVTIKFPIFLKDLFDLAENHRILYINAHRHLPPAMQNHLEREARRLLDPRNVPSIATKGIHVLLSHLVNLYRSEWGITFPKPLTPLLTWRLCKSLALTPEHYESVLRLLDLLQPFELVLAPVWKTMVRDSGRGIERKVIGRGKAVREHGLAGIPEGVLAAALIVVFKAKGKTVVPPGWLETLDQVRDAERKGDPRRLWRWVLTELAIMEVTSMTSKDIDDYLSFFEHNIIGDQLPPKRMQDFERYFPIPPPSEATEFDFLGNDSTYHVDELISKLYRNPTSAPPTDRSEPDPPQEVYYQYPFDASASLPEPLATLTRHLASLIGHTSISLSAIVIKLENLLQARMIAHSQGDDDVPAIVLTRRSRHLNKKEAMERRFEAWEKEKERRLELDDRDRGDRVRRRGTQMMQKSQAFIDDLLEELIEQEIQQEMEAMEGEDGMDVED
ncbi:BQ5605_C014g07625 [Microbotryum silenes-dioicae]|uniref:BQ5605_C014g07625 protein n=1 Tax=Microbotryum silenes-dioicae TaxID=796604 RepID=A0A2X0LU22_9BASI|nr:BQ5605_C014g07625 [Microbotryum silenes-dioicae]